MYSIDPDEYLPSQTMDWCRQVLKEIGIEGILDFESSKNGQAVYLSAFLHLRKPGFEYLVSGGTLLLCESPEGAYNWQPTDLDLSASLKESNTKSIETAVVLELYNELEETEPVYNSVEEQIADYSGSESEHEGNTV
jgi:hypothetical protein